jgi:adenylate cyclase
MGASARRRARALRARFERHLAPAVIRRIIANEDRPKLDGERREITALFTDIEGFTGMVGRAAPEALVAALDGYFDGVTRIALAHGGLVDKFVGDAVHVFFNMPFDLADHAGKALDCALEIVRWSEAYRREPSPAALGFGRTRVGLESGPALVGDVGGGAKLDYTAHGETVNAAARLEQANKVTGSAICVGPGATARIAPGRLRPVGKLELRGFLTPVAAASPWPDAADASWRERYLEAMTQGDTNPAQAARAFAALAAELDDPVAARLADA